MRLKFCFLTVVLLFGCYDESQSGANQADSVVDMAVPTVDGMTPVLFDMQVVLVPDAQPDMGRPMDAAARIDMRVQLYVCIPPDVGPLDGDACDPRLNARACDPGYFCVHIPQQRPNVGRCQPGDGCRPGVPDDCPPDTPYCHLKGGSTVCTEAGVLASGDDCVNDLGIPQPCAAGLVCNNSICQVPCIPGEEADCPHGGRCADISERIGVAGGLCGPRHCNWFNGDLCEAGEKCSYAIRSDGVLVGTCTELGGPGNPDGSMCLNQAGGGDNCAQGLVCIGPPGRERFCRILCDTGQYEAPCPGTMACEERLATSAGPVRSYGLCVTNQ
jgi:hypothetical protein